VGDLQDVASRADLSTLGITARRDLRFRFFEVPYEFTAEDGAFVLQALSKKGHVLANLSISDEEYAFNRSRRALGSMLRRERSVICRALFGKDPAEQAVLPGMGNMKGAQTR
jgi:hypothetical protein